MTKIVLPNGEFSDDGTAARDMRGYGYMDNLLPLAQGQIMVAQQVIEDRHATEVSVSASAGSAGQAADSVTAAGLKVVAAIEQVALAKVEADRSRDEAVRAKTEADRAAQAAGSVDPKTIADIEGLQTAIDTKLTAPPLAGNANKALFVTASGDSVEARSIPQQHQTGDVLVTARNPGAGWLTPNTPYLQSAYPALAALLGVRKDTPIGSVWSVRSNAPISTAAAYPEILSLSGSVVLIAASDRIYRSTNRGVSWTTVFLVSSGMSSGPGVIRSLRRITSSLIIGILDYMALRSNDGGLTWSMTVLENDTNARFTSVLRLSDSFIVIGGYYNTNSVPRFQKSMDGGATWLNLATTGLTTGIVGLAAASPDAIYATCLAGRFYKSTNQGVSWDIILSGGTFNLPFTLPDDVSTYPATMLATSDMVLFIAGAGSIYRSIDGGVNLSSVGGGGAVMSIVDLGGGIILATSKGGMYSKSIDGGATWSAPTYVVDASLAGIRATKLSPTEVLTIELGASVRRSSDYSYDEITQFKTPVTVAGFVGASAYIKA